METWLVFGLSQPNRWSKDERITLLLHTIMLLHAQTLRLIYHLLVKIIRQMVANIAGLD